MPTSQLTDNLSDPVFDEMAAAVRESTGYFLSTAERTIGLDNRENVALRVAWVNKLREVVGRNAPKNKHGTAIVSDVDLLMCTVDERREAFLRLIKRWP